MKQILPDKYRRLLTFFNSKLLMVMKLTVILLTCFTLAVHAAGFAQKVNIKVSNAKIENVCAEIKKQTGFLFLYDKESLEKAGYIDLDLKNTELNTALDIIAAKKSLKYKIIDKTIILSENSTQETKANQEVKIQGKVTSKGSGTVASEPLAGVIVNLKNTTKSVATNANGEFSINANSDAILVFSFIGFDKREIAVNGKTLLNVTLNETVNELNEVVITGYGTTERKENQVGSTYTVNSKDLEYRLADRVDKMLEGLVPGLTVESQDNSNASSRSRLATRIRGEASTGYGISSNEPLYIVDGVPIFTGGTTNMMPGVEVSVSPLSYLNPEDIESISVLKDASATTIYGANAANGVILITTKRGKGKSSINYHYRAGVNTLSNDRLKMLNGPQYNSLLTEMGYTANVFDNNTDWTKVFYRNGINQQHNLSMSGANDKNDYYISLGYYNEQPMAIENDIKRISARINFGQKIGKRIDLKINTESSYNLNDLFGTGNFYTLRPNISPYNADGSFALRDNEGNRLFPSLAEAYQNDNNQKTFNNRTNANVSVKLFDGLTFNSNSGIEFTNTTEDEYRSTENLSGSISNGYVRRNQVEMLRWLSSNSLVYNKKFLEGEFDAVVGTEAQQTKRSSTGVIGTNLPNNWIKEPSLAPDAYRRGSSSSDDQTAMSYFGKLGYVWKSRYALTYSMRRDGNSNFGSDVRWANFWAAGTAWTISNEDFWKSEILTFAKLKGSYGTNGNSRFSAASARGIYSFDEKYTYGDEMGAVMTGGLNNSLKWETTRMLNIGLDIHFVNRFTFAVEYYLNKTHDLIDDANVTLTSGQRRIYQNVGKLQNQGLEFVINSQNIVKDNFTWSTRFLLGLNRSKILELAEGLDRVYGTNILRVGEDAKAFYMIRWAGVDPSTGRPMWYDNNGNITFTYSTANRVITGSPTPDFFGSISNNITYKNFSLSAQLMYNVGGKTFSQVLRNATNDGTSILEDNQPVDILNHWKTPGDLAVNPMLTKVSNSSAQNSTRYLLDKTYIKLNNISLSYMLPQNFIKRMRLTRASVYAQGDNLGMWVPEKGGDFLNTYKNLYSSSPTTRVFSFGVKVGL